MMWTDRKKEKLAQKVLELSKCESKVEKRLADEELTLEVKEDGLYSFWLMNAEGNCEAVLSRTGNALKNVETLQEHIPEAFSYVGAYVLIAELCNDTVSLEELGAMVKSSRKKPLTDGLATKAKKATKTKPAVEVGDRIHFDELEAIKHNYLRVFDLITMDEFNAGRSDTPQIIRREQLEVANTSNGWNNNVFHLSVELAWGSLSLDEINKYAQKYIESGKEGIVGKFDQAPWVAGNKGDNYFKIVSGYDVDLLCVGHEMGDEGTKREGMVNKLIFQWRKFGEKDGEIEFLKLDGRATDEMRIEWAEDPAMVEGMVFKVHGLCIGSQGSIRLGKFHEIRLDKSEPDL